MRTTAIWDWCVNGLWLGLAAGLFLAAMVPIQSAGSGADFDDVTVQLAPENPLPGETVLVRVRVGSAGQAPRAGCAGFAKEIAVDAGGLSARCRTAASRTPVKVTGQRLSGDLSCIRWTLPEGPGPAQLAVTVGGQAAVVNVETRPPGTLRLASSLDWLGSAVNLWHSLGVRYR